MGSFSDYLENKLLNHVFLGATMDQPPHTWIALTTRVLTDTATGQDLDEFTNAATGYARRVCSTWSVSSGDDGAVANSEDLTFEQASANWGTMVSFAIMDTATIATGNVLAHGALTISKSVQSGDTPKFAAGDLDVTLD